MIVGKSLNLFVLQAPRVHMEGQSEPQTDSKPPTDRSLLLILTGEKKHLHLVPEHEGVHVTGFLQEI